MKQLLCLLLSVYCLSISALPCRDACNSHEHKAPVTFQQASEHHEQENDQCSPFCYCACCSSTVITPAISHYIFTEVFSVSAILPVKDSKIAEQAFAIWQPPKLS
ncbi:MAG: DUF6660 family protein [Chitinophagales bacterium]